MLILVFNSRTQPAHGRLGGQTRADTTMNAGFAAVSITPEIADTWTDVTESYRFKPREGDIWEDVTESGRFDAVWMAGFQNNKPAADIRDHFADTVYTEPSFDKARAQGIKLAQLSLDALRSDETTVIDKGGVTLRAQTVKLPLYNRLYRLGAALGVLQRGSVGWMKVRSEVAFWQIGAASFLHHPGELYLEIAEGGVEAPEGQDFDIPPQEVPLLRPLIPGKYTFMAGLSNDMIGYIVPKSQWDEKPPHTYGNTRPPYGEINSLGPETAPLLHSALMKLILDETGDP